MISICIIIYIYIYIRVLLKNTYMIMTKTPFLFNMYLFINEEREMNFLSLSCRCCVLNHTFMIVLWMCIAWTY